MYCYHCYFVYEDTKTQHGSMAGKLWIKPSDLGQYFVFMYDMVLPGQTAWTRSAGSIGLPARVEADSNLRGWERRGVSQGAWRHALRSLQPACSHLILMRTPRTWDHGHPHFLEDKSEA